MIPGSRVPVSWKMIFNGKFLRGVIFALHKRTRSERYQLTHRVLFGSLLVGILLLGGTAHRSFVVQMRNVSERVANQSKRFAANEKSCLNSSPRPQPANYRGFFSPFFSFSTQFAHRIWKREREREHDTSHGRASSRNGNSPDASHPGWLSSETGKSACTVSTFLLLFHLNRKVRRSDVAGK